MSLSSYKRWRREEIKLAVLTWESYRVGRITKAKVEEIIKTRLPDRTFSSLRGVEGRWRHGLYGSCRFGRNNGGGMIPKIWWAVIAFLGIVLLLLIFVF